MSHVDNQLCVCVCVFVLPPSNYTAKSNLCLYKRTWMKVLTLAMYSLMVWPLRIHIYVYVIFSDIIVV